MTVNVLRYRSWPDAILFIEDPPVLTMRERSRTKDTKTLDPSQTKHHDAQSERSSPVRYSKYRSSVSYSSDEQHTTHVRGRGQRRSSVQDELVKFRASRSIPPEDAQKKFLLMFFRSAIMCLRCLSSICCFKGWVRRAALRRVQVRWTVGDAQNRRHRPWRGRR